MLKQKVTAMMLAFAMMFSVSVPAFAESFEKNELNNYFVAVEKVRSNKELPEDIKKLLLDELEKRRDEMSSSVYDPKTEMGINERMSSFGDDYSQSYSSDGYYHIKTDYTSVAEFRRRSNDFVMFGLFVTPTTNLIGKYAPYALVKKVVGFLPVKTIRGVSYVIAAGIWFRYRDFTDNTVLRTVYEIKWGDGYDFILRMTSSFWCEGIKLNAFYGGKDEDVSIWDNMDMSIDYD